MLDVCAVLKYELSSENCSKASCNLHTAENIMIATLKCFCFTELTY